MIPFLKRDVIGSGNMKKDIFCTITDDIIEHTTPIFGCHDQMIMESKY
jgi:hypothetical protein